MSRRNSAVRRRSLVDDDQPSTTTLAALGHSQSSLAPNGELRAQWRVLGFAAGAVALLTAPGAYYYLHRHDRLGVPVSLLLTFAGVVMTRALVELGLRRFVPSAAADGADRGSLTNDALT